MQLAAKTKGLNTVEYQIRPAVTSADLNRLFALAWEGHRERLFEDVLAQSLVWVCAFSDGTLVGFVNVAWDGGEHAFLLDTKVSPDVQRRGIGRELVRVAVDAARERGVVWMHVDFEPALKGFYAACAFRPTAAGLIRLN